MSFNFVITHMFPGNDKQKNIGIHATFNMNITNADGVVASLRDLKLCQSKAGEFYIGSPYREYDSGGEKKKVQFIKLFPDPKDKAKQDKLVQMVKVELSKTASQPKVAKTTTSSDDAW